MAEPQLTGAQLQGLKDAKALADAGSAGAANQVAAIHRSIASQQNLDDGMRSLFDYNDKVITQYELERRWMDGNLLQDPITEADIIAFVDHSSGARLENGTNLQPKRISQFDGSPIAYVDRGLNLNTYPILTLDQNELAQYTVQDYFLNLLKNGFNYATPSQPISIATDLTPTGTRFTTNSVSGGIGLTSGQWVIVSGPSVSAVMQIGTITGGALSGSAPFTIQFSYVVPPNQTILAGPSIGTTLTGFTDLERSTKTTASSNLQNVLDFWIGKLQETMNLRGQVLSKEIAAFNANGNERKSAQAGADKAAALTFIQNYLLSTDISDTGINSLNSERDSRKNQISQRILIDIKKEILNGANGSFYDRRYNLALARAVLGNGSLYVLHQLQNQLGNISASQASALALSERWSGFLPPS